MRGFTVKVNDGSQAAQPIAPVVDPRGLDIATAPVTAAVVDGGSPIGSKFDALRSGQIIDRYQIVKLIATGSTSHVYEAFHQFTHKRVALKLMHHSLSQRQDVVQRFRQEAVLLSSIRHKNVVAVDNAGLTKDGHVFIAMELLIGTTLRERLNARGKLTVRDTWSLVDEAAAGVQAAHAANCLHRDLKPENIFCLARGGAKILDLGTAKFAGEHTPTIQTAFGRVVGTAAYIAPERLSGHAGDARSDIYALGLITYECLAGHHPLSDSGQWPSVTELADRHLSYQPAVINDVSPALWHVIACAIQKHPARRHKTVAAFRNELQRAVHAFSEAQSRGREHGMMGYLRALLPSAVAGCAVGVLLASLLRWSVRPQPAAQEKFDHYPNYVAIDSNLLRRSRLFHPPKRLSVGLPTRVPSCLSRLALRPMPRCRQHCLRQARKSSNPSKSPRDDVTFMMTRVPQFRMFQRRTCQPQGYE